MANSSVASKGNSNNVTGTVANNANRVQMTSTAQEIDLLDLFFYLQTKLVQILVAFFIGCLVCGTFTYCFITPTYQAQSYIYMVSSSSGSVIDLSDLNLGTSIANDYSELILRRPILENVIDKLSDDIIVVGDNEDVERDDSKLYLSKSSDLGEYITTSTVNDTRILCISVVTAVPELSKDIANALADEAVNTLPTIMNSEPPTIAEYAVRPTTKYTPNITKNAIMGGMLAAVACIAVYTLLHLMDDAIIDSEDIEKEFKLMPLAVVPKFDLIDAADTESEVKLLNPAERLLKKFGIDRNR